MQSPIDITALLKSALAEDIGTGDVTSMATIPAEMRATFVMRARGELVVSGLVFLPQLFAMVQTHILGHPGEGRDLEPKTQALQMLPEIPAFAGMTTVEVKLHVRDGDRVSPGASLATLTGPARALLSGERVALNLVQQLSGVATLTAQYVKAVEGTGAVILDTRKTIPGLRTLQKYAVVCGGGKNHRMGLYDAVLIKDNHIAVAGGVAAAVAAAREYVLGAGGVAGVTHSPCGRGATPDSIRGRGEGAASSAEPHQHAPLPSPPRKGEGISPASRLGLTIEVECDTLAQLNEALVAGADVVLLDNMNNAQLREAVIRVRDHNKATGQQVKTEASGNVSLETVRGIAETGVDFISVGKLTHSAVAVDIGLDEA